MTPAASGILLRAVSGLLFVTMSAIVRSLAGEIPVGELVFFRSLPAVIPLLLYLWWQRELPRGLITRRPGGHALRSLFGCVGIFAGFTCLRFLPLAEAQALGFVSPIFLVLLAGLLLGEVIRPVRWLGVTLGFLGVLVMVAPEMGGGLQSTERLLGAVLALVGALMGALVSFQIRRLGSTESPGAIALYFALVCTAVSLATIPFGWVMPNGHDLVMLLVMGLIGGGAQITMTLAFARTEASVLAPFEYLTMVWALGYGIILFGEWPGVWTMAGAGIVLFAVMLVAQVEGMRRRAATR